MLYNALLLPHINYCLVTWGYQCKRIDILQKRAIRLITLSKYNSHTAPLFKKLKLLTIKDMLALQELKFYYKLTHNELPDYFQNWQLVRNSNYIAIIHVGNMIFTLWALDILLQNDVGPYSNQSTSNIKRYIPIC